MSNKNDPVEWVTAYEVAAALQVSDAAVYRWVHAGEVPAFTMGKVIRIPKWWLDDTLDRYRKGQSVEEYSQTALIEEGRRVMRAIAAATKVGAA